MANKRRTFDESTKRNAVYEVNKYRSEHPGTTVIEALKALNIKVTDTSWYKWKKAYGQQSTGEIPLDAIPAREPRAAAKKTRSSLSDNEKAAVLLELAAKLLKGGM